MASKYPRFAPLSGDDSGAAAGGGGGYGTALHSFGAEGAGGTPERAPRSRVVLLLACCCAAGVVLFAQGRDRGVAAASSARRWVADVRAAQAPSTDGISPHGDETDFVQSESDARSYRLLTLPNSLQVLIISDPQTDRAAAAVDVRTGSWDDPTDVPGLAHFTEHMLFLGSEKYPDESSYAAYLGKHGGSSNAYTADEDTNFYFEGGPPRTRARAHARTRVDCFACRPPPTHAGCCSRCACGSRSHR